MRKLLLATTAALGATVGIAGGANAGTLTPNAPNPAPGSITVTFNAVVEAFVFSESDTAKVRAESAPGGGTKSTSYGIGTYSRLFPSFDGVLANGLKYGASAELRHRSGVVSQPNGAGPGVSTALSGTQAVFYNQREFLYIGADRFGKVIVGSAVQPTELFQTGNPANFNTGGWDGDLPGVFGSGLGYYIDDDNDTANKIIYVSPQFAGFDFGASYEPNNFGRDFGGPGGARVSSGNSSPQFGSRRSTADGAVRYQGSFGPFGVKANVGGSYGGTVRSSVIGTPNRRDFEFVGGGLAVTYAGFEVDGHIDSGVYGRDFNPVNRGAKGTTAYVVGGSYTFGPVIVGASYYGYNTGENKDGVNAIGTNHAYGIAAGGTYTLAPGASVFLEYLYGHQKNNGYDLLNSAPGRQNNKVQSQGIGLGTAFKF